MYLIVPWALKRRKTSKGRSEDPRNQNPREDQGQQGDPGNRRTKVTQATKEPPMERWSVGGRRRHYLNIETYNVLRFFSESLSSPWAV